MKRHLLEAIFILLVLLLISIIFFVNYTLFWRPMISLDKPSLIITLDKKTTALSFVHDLKAQKLIQSQNILLFYIRLQRFSQKLKAGVYQVKPNETVSIFLERVVDGDVLVLPFRIISGKTQKDVTEDAQNAPYLLYKSDSWNKIQDKYQNAEGLLLADTYHYDAGSDSESIFIRANQNLNQYLNKSWQSRMPDLPYKTPYEMLIAASIIEKEAAVPEERKIISGVIVNRLAKKMRLQMDPTVIYSISQRYNKVLTHQDLLINSPYNTYFNYGLPPTPIAMVGSDSIDAAAQPQMSSYLYYVAKGDGRHEFSETYKDHSAAIKKYLRNDK